MIESSIGLAARSASLLVVGAATRDIDRHDPRGWRLGGGVTYGALTASRLGLAVKALIGVDEQAATAPELDLLRAAGVELSLFRLDSGPVMENRPLPGGARLQLVQQASDRLPPSALPHSWRTVQAVLLAPVAGELGPAWARVVAGGAIVALAWQGLFRRLVPGQPMIHLPLKRQALIERADLALVSADDVGRNGPALIELLRRDGQQLVVSHGHRGALHISRTGARLVPRYLPALASSRIVDETGAGDVFLAAWCAAMMVGQKAGRHPGSHALAIATAAASLSVEGRLAQLPHLWDVCRRLGAPTSQPGS